MKYLTTILLGLASTAAGASLGARSESAAPLPMGEIGWEGSVTPGGPAVKIWGDDLDDIERKIQEDHPEFRMYLDVENELSNTSENAAPENPIIEAREALNGNCNSGWGKADVGWLNNGINALKRIDGNKCSTRGRTCIRTQCQRNSAIVLCNDNNYTIDVKCTDIASMAEYIRQHCFRVVFPLTCNTAPNACAPHEHYAHGQTFSPGRSWNVIVGSCGRFPPGERPHSRLG